MTGEERNEISRLPKKYRTLGGWAYFWYAVLFNIPVIGWLALFICALSSSNINRRSFARSYFCALLVVFILLLLLIATAAIVYTLVPQFSTMVNDLIAQLKAMLP